MQLNKRVTIQRRGSAQDTVGQTRETWKTTATVWASIRPVSAREFYQAESGANVQRSEITHEIVLRFGPKVRARDRIKYNDRTFDIQSVVNTSERDRYLKLMAVENGDV